jgi:hypothetical protein
LLQEPRVEHSKGLLNRFIRLVRRVIEVLGSRQALVSDEVGYRYLPVLTPALFLLI